MRAFKKAGILLTASAAALGGSLLSTPVRAAEAGVDTSSVAAAPAEAAAAQGAELAAAPAAADAKTADTTVAQSSVIVEEAIEYEQGTGFYGTVGLGGAWPDSINGRVNRRSLPDRNIDFKMTGGFALDAGIGYDFGPARAELTYIYNRNGVDDIDFRKRWQARNTSGGNQNGFMASGYWDISTGSRFTPYIGAGIGYINQNWGENTLVKKVNGDVVNRIKTKGGNVGLFGWQAKAGVAYGVNWNTDLYAEAVYQGGSSFDVGRTSYDAINSWGFKIGARYRFGGPEVAVVEEVAPAPEPAPAPAPAPVYQEPAPAPAPVRGLW